MYLPRSRGRDDDGDEDHDERHEAARAEALDHAHGDEGRGVLGEARDRRADDEQADRRHEQRLAVHQVGELAPDRGRDGGGEQARGDDPGVGGLVAAEVGDDERHRGRDDRAGDDGDEHRHDEAGDGDDHLARGALRRNGRNGAGRGLVCHRSHECSFRIS